MPIPTTAKWPKPKSEDEFEDIVLDSLRVRWRDANTARNGRRGQRQNGVDIFGHPAWFNGATAGAQCKNTEAPTLAMVKAEVDKAKTFPGGLAEFLFITAAERDAAFQAEVREHFRSNPAPFHVEILFWPDVVNDLCTDDALVGKHWKGFDSTSPTPPGLPGPRWIDREGASPRELSECHTELYVALDEPGIDLDASELCREMSALTRDDSSHLSRAARIFEILLAQPTKRLGDIIKFVWSHRPFGNVLWKFELEVACNGMMVYRVATFRDDNMRLFEPFLFVESIVVGLTAHRCGVERAGRRQNLRVPEQFTSRLSANASGPMLLGGDDDGKIIQSRFLLSAPSAPSQWTVQVTSAGRVDALAARLLNRGLSQFTIQGELERVLSGMGLPGASKTSIEVDEKIVRDYSADLIARYSAK